jgi:hypothetical protein
MSLRKQKAFLECLEYRNCSEEGWQVL